jgi:two-component system OmpR family response regulator
MLKLLMIEDDIKIAELLVQFLEQNEFLVTHVIKPSIALETLANKTFDIIILDLTLPEMDGLILCKTLKNMYNIPIIISSARSDISDKLQALDDGADDYLPKPYDPRELIARIKNVLKRSGVVVTENSDSPFRLEEQSTQIYFNDTLLDLTRAEYQILKLFLDNIGQTIERSDLANSIDSHRFESGVESINVLIGRLRKKIETDSARPIYIKTVRGIGYRFDLV